MALCARGLPFHYCYCWFSFLLFILATPTCCWPWGFLFGKLNLHKITTLDRLRKDFHHSRDSQNDFFLRSFRSAVKNFSICWNYYVVDLWHSCLHKSHNIPQKNIYELLKLTIHVKLSWAQTVVCELKRWKFRRSVSMNRKNLIEPTEVATATELGP